MAAATPMPTHLLPRFFTLAASTTFRQEALYTRAPILPLIPSLLSTLPGIRLNLPTLNDIWESVLRAVPKKKTSHSKKRHRQMAGKALKDVNSLCQCPGCGETKRMHRLCSRCLEDMRRIWREDYPTEKSL